jgi:lipopolysaccharide/colanic/teichoic acid biosynthesis glycosyltransferase
MNSVRHLVQHHSIELPCLSAGLADLVTPFVTFRRSHGFSTRSSTVMFRLARALLHVSIVAVTLGFTWSYAARHTLVVEVPLVASFFLFVVAVSIAAYVFGLPHSPSRSRAVVASVAAPFVGQLVIALLQLASIDRLLPRSVVFGASLTLVPIFLAIWAGSRWIGTVVHERQRVALVADAAEIDEMRDGLARPSVRSARLVEAMTPEVARTGRLVVDLTSPRTEPVVGTSNVGGGAATMTETQTEVTVGLRPLVDIVRAAHANVLVLSRAALSDPVVLAQATALHQDGIRVRPLAEFSERHLGKVPVSELQQAWLLFDIGEIHSGFYPRVKRLIDLAGALVLVPVLLAVIPFVVLGNLIGNRGPLFYRQPRVGKAGKVFSILKFRSMQPTASVGGSWTQEHDPRVTSFGRMLRRTHLDELPQLINILRGELSFVGPRPEQPLYVAELEAAVPHFAVRHLVRPGLTGWAQVCHPYGATVADSIQKLQYDVVYLRRQSLGLDVRILGRTLQQLPERRGR